jgi:protein involved in polysaccharide export with SLBB domain
MVAVGIFFCFTARAHAQDARTRLRPGDALRIEVKDEPQFSGEFAIGQDGMILLPVLGTVRVTDLPFAEVDGVLRKRLAGELVDPVIRITPLLRIAVLGEVRQPGLFLVDPTFSAADILARAGGLTSRPGLTSRAPYSLSPLRPAIKSSFPAAIGFRPTSEFCLAQVAP